MKADVMQKKKLVIAVAWIVFIMLLGVANHKTNDRYEINTNYQNLSTIFGTTTIDDANQRLNAAVSESEATVIATPKRPLEKGAYLLTINYTTTLEDNYMIVYSESAVNENNQKGIVLEQQTLASSQQTVVVPVEADKNYRDIQICFKCQNGELSVGEVNIKSTKAHFSDAIFLSLVACILIVLFTLWDICKKNKELEKEKKLIILILGSTIVISMLPLLNDFLIAGIDIKVHLSRIEGIYQGILNGQIPLRINPIQSGGYGYAMPILYPDIFLYIAAVFRLCGVSLMLSYKLLILCINIATIVIAYFACKNVFHSKNIAIVASIVYTLNPYRFVNLYERAALGEAIAMIFLPLIMWGLYELLAGNSKKWYIAGIGYACVFQSHILTMFMVCLFTLLAVVIEIPRLIKEKERIIKLFYAAVVSFLLAVWNIIPFVEFMKLPLNVGNEKSLLHERSLYLQQIFTNYWGSGTRWSLTLGQTKDEMPMTVGVILLIGIVLFFWYYIKEEKSFRKRAGLYCFGMGMFSILMSSWLFPWDALQKIGIINELFSKLQFCSRFLGIASVFLSVTAAIGITELIGEEFIEKKTMLAVVCILVISCGFLQGALEKNTIQNKSEAVGIDTSDGLYLLEGTYEDSWEEEGDALAFPEGTTIDISNYHKYANEIEFDAKIASEGENNYVELPLAYYPGYVATCNSVKIEPEIGENNKLRIRLPGQGGRIKVVYKENTFWIICDIVSLVTVILLAMYIVKERKQR